MCVCCSHVRNAVPLLGGWGGGGGVVPRSSGLFSAAVGCGVCICIYVLCIHVCCAHCMYMYVPERCLQRHAEILV